MTRVMVALAGFAMLVPVPARAFTQQVAINGIAFDPRVAQILPGDTVVWTNMTDVIHTVTDRTCLTNGACAFDAELGGDESLTVTFPASGVFLYQCRIHGFSAEVRVADAPGTLPDLAVSGVSAAPATVAGVPLPTTTRIETSIVNEGTASSPPSELVVEYRYRNRWRPIDVVLVQALSPGASAVLNVLWDTSHSVGDLVVRAVVDPQGAIHELRSTNNQGSVTASLLTPPGVVPGMDLLAPMG